MSIEEIKKEKERLERQLFEMIMKFQDDSGLKFDSFSSESMRITEGAFIYKFTINMVL